MGSLICAFFFGKYFHVFRINNRLEMAKTDKDQNNKLRHNKEKIDHRVTVDIERDVSSKEDTKITSITIELEGVDQSAEQYKHFINKGELSFQVHEWDKEEAFKCIEKAQAAFLQGQYDIAEHFLLKSLRIYDNKTATTFLETVLKAKAQENTKVNVETEKNNKELINDYTLNEKANECNKCIDKTEIAIADEDLDLCSKKA